MSDARDAAERELPALLEAAVAARSRRLIDTIHPDAGPPRRELYPKR